MIYVCEDAEALALTAPGAPFETEGPGAAGRFRHHPHRLADLYRAVCGRGAQRLAEVDGRTYSHEALFGRAARLGAVLVRDFGLQPGDPVGLAMTAGMEWMAAFVAVTAAGGVAVLVNTRGAADEMAHALGVLGCRLAIADGERAGRLLGHPGAAGLTLLVAGAAGLVRPGRDRDLGTILEEGDAPPFRPVDRDPGDAAIVLFTSGTTGRPKAVRIDQGALCHSVVLSGLVSAWQDRRYEAEFGRAVPLERSTAKGATLISAPVFHFSGVMPFLRGLYFGAPLFVMTRWNADASFDLMEREAVTRLGFVPTMLRDMLDSPRASAANLGQLLVLSNGAASLDTRLVERLHARFPTVMLANTYGQTESSGWGTSICGRDYLEHPRSAGYALPTVRLRILGADGRDVAPGQHGEVCLQSPALMREYVGDPAATAATLQGGWLRTGDIGWVDDDGRLQIADRLKNMVITGGENVYCAEVERVLGEHDAVAEVVAYGLPDDRLGEVVGATVVLKPGAAADADTLLAHARGLLAGYKVPRVLRLQQEPLPRTATMKIDRGRLLAERRAST
jgi:acyl-CoA synthetase (AMP-forming)/AMP-acid ligase II